MKIHVGAAYYPETCDNNRVRYDADLMKKAGISFVRMGEFAWSSLEPHENEFQFQWLHDAELKLIFMGFQTGPGKLMKMSFNSSGSMMRN